MGERTAWVGRSSLEPENPAGRAAGGLNAQFHGQDDHLRAEQVKAPLQRHRRLVVQQLDEPVVVVEDQLAGEKDRVGELGPARYAVASSCPGDRAACRTASGADSQARS